MRRSLERAWVRVLDSSTWRAALRGSVVRGLRSSRAFAAADRTRRSVLSGLHAWRARDRYEDIGVLALFVGHTKSGGSLLGALLDAHPNAVFADEADALKYFTAGFRPGQVYHLLEKGSRREAMKGRVTARRLEPYSLAVPDQWQGSATTLRVVGDSRAGVTTQRLGAELDLVHRLDERLGDVDLRLLHVVRNPFDPMSAMIIRGGRTFAGAMQRYFANCEILEQLHARLPSSTIRLVRYEDMVADPVSELAAVCDFLGLVPGDEYLEACASIIHARAAERTLVEWHDDHVERVTEEMARYSFLDGYAFDRPGRLP